jgi:hypothetical protein
MKASEKLRAKWKNEDILFCYPVGIDTKSDAHWLANRLFNDDFMRQATERGYDISTFKFELSPAKNNEKFESQRKSNDLPRPDRRPARRWQLSR